MVNQLLKEHRGEYYFIDETDLPDNPLYYYHCKDGIPYLLLLNRFERVGYIRGGYAECLGAKLEFLGKKDLKVRSRIFFTKKKFLFANFYEYQMTDENHIVNSINKELNL